MSMKLLPAKKGTCPVCATKHPEDFPHNQQSLYYQYRFLGEHGRWPTWSDALAHCDSQMKEFWEQELRSKEAWSEPDDGEPIADDPAEAVHKIIDMTGKDFTP